MNTLDKLFSKETIKNADKKTEEKICETIRELIIDTVNTNGGHLASNLGVVELTYAMHKVFDFPKDKVVFDVGHQSYVHKILSGRYDKLHTIRKFGGISGFPKTSESEYDSFNTGHSSTSISAALGIARARDLQNEDYNVIAFIGDGALGGGMAFEAMNDLGETKTKLIIILNDNEMSINRNVGGLSAHLSMLRTEKSYLNAKDKMHSLLAKTGKVGRGITKLIRSIKKSITFLTVSEPMFEELGIKYIGIIDGHDIGELTEALNKAKNIEGPVIIHALTKKGKGYKCAEDNPDIYHGVSARGNKQPSVLKSYTQIFGDYMSEKAENTRNLVAITAAMCGGCGLDMFSKKYPDRFYDVGIAEQHAVTMAAGLASKGIIPVFSVYSTFLQRGYDQVLHDVCMQNLHVVFAIDRAGIVGEDGETHHGVFDFSYLTHLPNVTLLAPSCEKEFVEMLDYAIDVCSGPVFLRYPRAQASRRDSLRFCDNNFEVISKTGSEVIILSIGRMLECSQKVAASLEEKGISSTVINVRCVKPFSVDKLEALVTPSSLVVTIEDNVISGGAGQYICSLSPKHIKRFVHFGFGDAYIQQGSQDELFEHYGLTPMKISADIIKEINDYEQ